MSEAPLSAEATGDAPGRGRLDGRRVLIVGGGQNDFGLDDPPLGNGRAMALLFAREGAEVVVADRVAEAAQATVDVVAADGGRASAVTADATDEADVVRMFAESGELDGLVLNVGIGAGLKLRGTSVEEWDLVLAANLKSHFLGVKHGLDAVRPGGAMVLIGSIAAHEVMPFPAYGASKAALTSLTRQAAAEAAPLVRANLLMPGLIDTPLGRAATQVNPARGRAGVPLRRQGTAMEIAYAALFLISGESSYMTGQSLIVDGGLSSGPRG